MANENILVVEDEAALATMLRYNLEKQGFRVEEATDGQEALTRIAEVQPDIVLLDWMLPVMSGIEVCRQIRRSPTTRELPVIFLTSKDEEIDELFGLKMGADDFIRKPFPQRLLVERVKAVLRRFAPKDGSAPKEPDGAKVLERGQLRMDPERHTCPWKNEPVTLTVTEFLILQALAARPGVVYASMWHHQAALPPAPADNDQAGGVIYKSTDGGRTWHRDKMPIVWRFARRLACKPSAQTTK